MRVKRSNLGKEVKISRQKDFLCPVHYIFWREINVVFSFIFSDEEEEELEEASEDEAPPVVAKPTKKAMKKGKQKTWDC